MVGLANLLSCSCSIPFGMLFMNSTFTVGLSSLGLLYCSGVFGKAVMSLSSKMLCPTHCVRLFKLNTLGHNGNDTDFHFFPLHFNPPTYLLLLQIPVILGGPLLQKAYSSSTSTEVATGIYYEAARAASSKLGPGLCSLHPF